MFQGVFMKTVGWIGTGQMGIPMATNLLKAGFAVNLYNRTPAKAQPLVAAGGQQLATAQEVVRHSDIIFLMLSNGDAIRDVLQDEAGVLAAVQLGKTIIDMSTISPEDSKAFAQQVAQKGGRYIDAPVSGSVGAAVAAQLVILVGAMESELVPYQPYFDALGKKTIAFGGVSKGSSAKLAINLLLAITGQGIAEAMLLAEKAGIEQESMLELIGQSSVNTGLFQFKKDMYLKQAFPAAFMLELMSKDLGLITDEAIRLGLNLPLAQQTHSTYNAAQEHGKGKLDMAAVYLELKEKNAQKA
ncbi:MAG: NAD(P)-dependent oxidoreductase [Desulfobulbus sp.]|nr:NAD(P)-dependent oxidoreductase [Desulfobulbus sp.]